MQEQLTDGADEQTIIETPGENTKRMRIARHVSNILAPATISLPFILLVAFYQTQDKLISLDLSPVLRFSFLVLDLYFISSSVYDWANFPILTLAADLNELDHSYLALFRPRLDGLFLPSRMDRRIYKL